MNSDAKQLPPLNPKFAGAIFFAIYGLLLMLFTKYTLLALQDAAILPLLFSIPIALITGAFVGGCFGKWLAKNSTWYRSFFIGILLAYLSLILGSLAVLMHSYFTHSIFLNQMPHWQDYLIIYGAILASFTVTLGIWFIPLTGLVAIYFNKQFLPGLIASDRQRLQADSTPKTDKADDK